MTNQQQNEITWTNAAVIYLASLRYPTFQGVVEDYARSKGYSNITAWVVTEWLESENRLASL